MKAPARRTRLGTNVRRQRLRTRWGLQIKAQLVNIGPRQLVEKSGAETLAPKDGCTSTAGAEDPENGAARLGFVFDFGTHSRRSSRVYRLRFSTCQTPPGSTRITLTEERFASATNLASTPVLREPAALELLSYCWYIP